MFRSQTMKVKSDQSLWDLLESEPADGVKKKSSAQLGRQHDGDRKRGPAKTIFAFTKHTGIYFDLSQLRWLERIAAYEPDEKVRQELENIIFWHENFMYCEIMDDGVKTYFTAVKRHFPNAEMVF
ncbi:hypothetical protein JSY36_05495 [Bacillus sp. H-16]|nr:hypothetical protein [Alteribacter salitolerans]